MNFLLDVRMWSHFTQASLASSAPLSVTYCKSSSKPWTHTVFPGFPFRSGDSLLDASLPTAVCQPIIILELIWILLSLTGPHFLKVSGPSHSWPIPTPHSLQKPTP